MSNPRLLAFAVIAASAPAMSAPLVPNTTKYSDRSPAAATGRSGTATLSARALLAKDGSTDMLVQAGRVDGSGASIAKLQLKAFDNSEQVAWTKNYTSLSGATQDVTLSGMLRGQPIQTQASIRSVDGARTDVVTTSGVVKLRPDLSALSLDGPQHGMAGSDLVFYAPIAELNGDTGATATCVLRVDGTEVDRAAGIWVDAGSTVWCSFTYAFLTTGTKQLQVAVVDVDPGDYDTSNNAANASITIYDPNQPAPFFWDAEVGWYYDHTIFSTYGWYQASDQSMGADWNYTQDSKAAFEVAALYGDADVLIDFPISLRISGSGDGQVFEAIDLEDQPAMYSYDDPDYSARDYLYTDAAGDNLFVNSYRFGNASTTYVELVRRAMNVNYLSSGYLHEWFDYGGTDYYYVMGDSTYTEGQFWPMTSTFDGSWQLVDASGRTFQASTSLVLQPNHSEEHLPMTCQTYDPSWLTGYSCSSQDTVTDVLTARAGGPQ